MGDRVVVLSGQGGVERPDAWQSTDKSGSPPTADSGSRYSRDSMAGTGWQFHKLGSVPQNVRQSEGEGCSAETCRGLLRGEAPRACRRGSVITSDRRYVCLATTPSKGDLGSRSWTFDHHCVPGQPAGQSAAVPGRTLRTRIRSPQNAAVARPGSSRARERKEPRRSRRIAKRACEDLDSAPGRTGQETDFQTMDFPPIQGAPVLQQSIPAHAG